MALDPRPFFSADAWSEAEDESSGRSRVTVRWMPVDDFLSAAEPGYNPEKAAGVKRLLDKGHPFDSLPFLYIDMLSERDIKSPRGALGIAKVIAHEGRHRTYGLKAAGAAFVPVRIRCLDGDFSIRGDQWTLRAPETVLSQDGLRQVPFPKSLVFGPQQGQSSRGAPLGAPMMERCPCTAATDPAVWLKTDHVEIHGILDEIRRQREKEARETIRKVLIPELQTHFRTEEDQVFRDLFPHPSARVKRALADLISEHAPFLREAEALARKGQGFGVGFKGFHARLLDHARREEALLPK